MSEKKGASQDPIKEMERKLLAMEDRIANAEASIKSELTGFKKEIPKNVDAHLRLKSKELKTRLSMLLEKLVVVSEVAFAARNAPNKIAGEVALNAVRAIDNDDQWWSDRKNYSIKEWFEEFSTQQVEELSQS